jgi:hypothetical protein
MSQTHFQRHSTAPLKIHRRDLQAECDGRVRRRRNGHIHNSLSPPAVVVIGEGGDTIKSNSSKWMRETKKTFAWQKGYGAFSERLHYREFQACMPSLSGQSINIRAGDPLRLNL